MRSAAYLLAAWPPTALTIDVFVGLARARVGDLEVIRGFARAERSSPDALRVL